MLGLDAVHKRAAVRCVGCATVKEIGVEALGWVPANAALDERRPNGPAPLLLATSPPMSAAALPDDIEAAHERPEPAVW
jgi:hypothetical protein